MSEPTYAEFLKKADLMNRSLTANATELWHMDGSRVRLDSLLTEARSLIAQQASLTASKQDVSKRLAELIDEGRKLLTFLRTGVKLHYGSDAEKLPEFGLQPFRGRPRPTLVGPDGKPLKPQSAEKVTPVEPQNQ